MSKSVFLINKKLYLDYINMLEYNIKGFLAVALYIEGVFVRRH